MKLQLHESRGLAHLCLVIALRLFCFRSWTGIPTSHAQETKLRTINGTRDADTTAASDTAADTERPQLSYKLTARELQVLLLLSQELFNKEIARQFGIETRTVKTHRRNIHIKMSVKNTAELVKKALGAGMISAPSPETDSHDPTSADKTTVVDETNPGAATRGVISADIPKLIDRKMCTPTHTFGPG
jgi:DNA-binding CsgD family transcriptional regulator